MSATCSWNYLWWWANGWQGSVSLRFLSGPALRDDPDFPCSVGRILWHTQTTRCIEQPNRTTSRIEGKVTGDCKRIKHEETEDWETKRRRRRRKGSITEGDGTDRGTAGDGAEVRGLEGLGGAGAPVEKQTGQGEPRHQQAEPQVPRQVRISRRRNLLATVAHLQAATVSSAATSFLRGRVCHRTDCDSSLRTQWPVSASSPLLVDERPINKESKRCQFSFPPQLILLLLLLLLLW